MPGLQVSRSLLRTRHRHPSSALQIPSRQMSTSMALHWSLAVAAPTPIEEQTRVRYGQKRYYPVRIGDVFNDRYRILTKLGYGAYSTDDEEASPVLNEVKMLKHLAECPNDHLGSSFARLADEIFEVDGAAGRHYCIAMKPQGGSLWNLQGVLPGGKFPVELVTSIAQRLLLCANWLVCECNVMHTETTTQNVLTQALDDSIFRRMEDEERETPSAPVEDGDHIIYPSRGQVANLLEIGDPLLADFGSARSTDSVNEDWWMPDTHRAPEILMGFPWDEQVDVWSIGIMALELLEGRNVFYPIDPADNKYVLPTAVAQYIGYMGLPPLWMIQQSKNPAIKSFFDDSGNWISEAPIPTTSLDEFVTSIPAGEARDAFLQFIKKILVWDPSERANSAELFQLLASAETG